MSLPDMRELERVVGEENVLTDPDLRAPFEHDWTGRFAGTAAAVVRPGSSGEVSGVLRWCSERHVAVVPQGGNTGLVGGSVPRARGTGKDEPAAIVLSLQRLANIERCDEDALLLVAGAGTTLAVAQERAAAIGCDVGIDLAARGSATLGGMVATNAGGIHVLRHGTMRSRVVGLEAVLADGTVVRRLDGLWKDNAGWELASLLAGSEGTLAVVTSVALRLVVSPPERVTALVALRATGGPGAAIGAAASAARALQRAVDGIEALEVTLPEGMELVRARFGLPAPPGGGRAAAWLTVEASGNSDPTDQLAAALERVGGVLDVAVASDRGGRERLWQWREAQAEAVSSLGVPHKLDVSVPVGLLSSLAAALPATVGALAPGARLICFGHVADGNLHVNVIGPAPEDERVDGAILRLALGLGGSISAEHGIGVAKSAYLRLARTPAELDLMSRVKRALDPIGILNPGVLSAP
ncbi:MAG: FAD-binding oxidoreductase [Actinomycetota bacterium]|nr:FAD-binding oxidoreductase [Actinomycetota bacterium]